MPIVFLGTGIILVLTGVKGDPSKLYTLVQGDFSGQNSYVYWLVSILVLGALGYVDSLKNLSRLFIVLVFVALVVHNGGFFDKLQEFFKSSGSAQASAA